MRRTLRKRWFVVFVAVGVGCGGVATISNTPGSDAGASDASPDVLPASDAGSPGDGAPPERDAASPGDADAAPAVDADAAPAADADADAGCSFTGFEHEYKCEPAASLWPNGALPGATIADCLTTCEQAQVAYCWYLDGTGGFPKDCRGCGADAGFFNGGFANDWAGGCPVPGSDAGTIDAAPSDGGALLATGNAGCAGRSFSGFYHEYKCELATSLWPQGAAPDASMGDCLAACEGAQGPTSYCWYLDGTGGFAKDCRTCAPDASIFNGGFSNDWAGTFSTPSCP